MLSTPRRHSASAGNVKEKNHARPVGCADERCGPLVCRHAARGPDRRFRRRGRRQTACVPTHLRGCRPPDLAGPRGRHPRVRAHRLHAVVGESSRRGGGRSGAGLAAHRGSGWRPVSFGLHAAPPRVRRHPARLHRRHDDLQGHRTRALLRHAPPVLLFGGWDSFAGLKVGAAKWPAALSGQILGFDAQLSRKTGVRVDPLEISIDDFQSYKAAAPAEVWTLDADAAEKDGKGKPVTLKPSEVGHGNIPAAVAFKGAWVSRIELRSALSITRLRRYHYPVNGVASPERDRDGGGAGRPREPLGEQRHPITGIRKHPCGPSADVQSLPGRRHRQRARAWQARPAGRCRRQPSRQRCAEQAAWLRAAPSRRIPRRCCHP